MRGMTVGELMDFLNEQPRSAEVLVCADNLTPTKDSFTVTDAIYVYSQRVNGENVILLFESEE